MIHAQGMERVFVYGTLRSGFQNHCMLGSSRLLGNARTRERYALYVSGIPYVVKAEAVSPIVGEVYEVNAHTLAYLDRFEGHPDWYRREAVAVEMEDGTAVTAWLYFSLEPSGHRIDSGDFADAQAK